MRIKPSWEDYGESSLTLLAVHAGLDKARPMIPYDPSDFKRCVHLFECLDLTKEGINHLLKETAGMYPDWKPFADNWDKLTELYLEEKDKAEAPKLYKLMTQLRANLKEEKC
jgi:hypothetical protein